MADATATGKNITSGHFQIINRQWFPASLSYTLVLCVLNLFEEQSFQHGDYNQCW